MQTPLPPAAVSLAQYTAYTNAWLTRVGNEELTDYFATTGGRSRHAALGVPDLVRLVSAVGARRIKARFGLEPDAEGTLRFVVLLWAADSADNRVSGYLAARLALPSSTLPGSNEPVPDALAKRWLDNWSGRKGDAVTPAWFKTAAGSYLRGYTFGLRDFMDTLFPVADLADDKQELRVAFGLHQYYSSADTEQVPPPVLTFGLVLQLPYAGKETEASFYDVSAPCPPTC